MSTIVKINGVEVKMHDSLGEAISSKVNQALENADWYNYEHPNFDLNRNMEEVRNICGDDLDCYADSLNWTLMNKTELTSNIYKFISHRASVVKDGLKNNFLPEKINWEAFSDNWDLVMDCILWF